ncbi:MAG: glycine--tRNA ligase subunit beta [Tagaea sp.]
MAELLLELLSEEIPARMQARAAEDFKRLATERLTAAGLNFTKAECYVTPRRLALVVDGLPARTPDLKEEKKGPRVGSPDQAIQGFLKGAGLTSLDACEKRMVGKAEFWFAVVEKKGQATEWILPKLVYEVITDLSWSKSMRWGTNRMPWVRPLQNVLAIFNGSKLDGVLRLGRGGEAPTQSGFTRPATSFDKNQADAPENGIFFSDWTVGHRFLAPARFAVTSFADYVAKLRAAKVILDQAERRAKILADATARAASVGLELRDDPGLLDEVTGLVEWPVVLTGQIDPQFMDVPQEALIGSMRAHQKYFAMLFTDGKLARNFAVVANMETEDEGRTIVAGNERVLRARLSDAKFFWDQDRKTKLRDRAYALKQRVFHAKLGTMFDKRQRMHRLATYIGGAFSSAGNVGYDHNVQGNAGLAADLAKHDLSSGMVGEFPELQGIMGRYYALNDGEHNDVADAIREHYQPLGPSDTCPSKPVSVIAALADKIDTLVGFWVIDEKPTGSKDPFALRRAALGVIRLIVENRLRLPLAPILDQAIYLISEQRMMQDARAKLLDVVDAEQRAGIDRVTVVPSVLTIEFIERSGLRAYKNSFELLAFFADRLKVALKEKGVRHDLIDAVFALGGEDDLVRLLARVDALGAFLKGQDGANLLIGYRRAANIVAIETKKDGQAPDGRIDPASFTQAEEEALFARLGAVKTDLDRALAAEDFAAAMAALATLRAPVDAFFEKVTVNAEDRALRANRLNLLSAIGAAPARVADFSKIEG